MALGPCPDAPHPQPHPLFPLCRCSNGTDQRGKANGKAVSVSLAKIDIFHKSLQMDHEYEIRRFYDIWLTIRQNLQPSPTRWDDGVNGKVLLFSLLSLVADPVLGAPWVRPRCKTHHVSMPHGRQLLDFSQ